MWKPLNHSIFQVKHFSSDQNNEDALSCRRNLCLHSQKKTPNKHRDFS